VDLVNEEQRLATTHAAGPGCFENLLEISDTGENRRDLIERQFGLTGQEPGHGGLAGARRPPEDHRTETSRGNHPGDRAIRAGQMRLPSDLGKACRPQPVGKRSMPAPGRLGTGEQITHRFTL
jgi:hypothetical protein